jgi:hypothetical protein
MNSVRARAAEASPLSDIDDVGYRASERSARRPGCHQLKLTRRPFRHGRRHSFGLTDGLLLHQEQRMPAGGCQHPT